MTTASHDVRCDFWMHSLLDSESAGAFARWSMSPLAEDPLHGDCAWLTYRDEEGEEAIRKNSPKYNPNLD